MTQLKLILAYPVGLSAKPNLDSQAIRNVPWG